VGVDGRIGLPPDGSEPIVVAGMKMPRARQRLLSSGCQREWRGSPNNVTSNASGRSMSPGFEIRLLRVLDHRTGMEAPFSSHAHWQ
jgi:hypothetical protein